MGIEPRKLALYQETLSNLTQDAERRANQGKVFDTTVPVCPTCSASPIQQP
ncbi:MAG TPA: hypothetical protein VKZ53_12670 [Candidatus Angelobacter sp.]|nr:hypothetical protein [Candidatus Angelobacter sp.]